MKIFSQLIIFYSQACNYTKYTKHLHFNIELVRHVRPNHLFEQIFGYQPERFLYADTGWCSTSFLFHEKNAFWGFCWFRQDKLDLVGWWAEMRKTSNHRRYIWLITLVWPDHQTVEESLDARQMTVESSLIELGWLYDQWVLFTWETSPNGTTQSGD